VIIESASPGLKSVVEKQARLRHDQAIAQRLETTDFDIFLKDWYRQPLFMSLSRHPAFAEVCKKRQKENPLQLAAALRLLSSGIQPSLWPELKNIKIPLLLLTGESDVKYSGLLTEMQKQCPDAQFKVIENAGHNTHLENPLVFLEYMSNFLSQTGEKE